MLIFLVWNPGIWPYLSWVAVTFSITKMFEPVWKRHLRSAVITTVYLGYNVVTIRDGLTVGHVPVCNCVPPQVKRSQCAPADVHMARAKELAHLDDVIINVFVKVDGKGLDVIKMSTIVPDLTAEGGKYTVDTWTMSKSTFFISDWGGDYFLTWNFFNTKFS